MKHIVIFISLVLCTIAAGQEPKNQAEVFLRWNGDVEITSPTVEREFPANESSIVIVEFIALNHFQRVLLLRDKGWRDARSDRPDLNRFEDISKELRNRKIVFDVHSVSSRALPTDQPKQ